jgi:D-alanine-D-alanine ligase
MSERIGVLYGGKSHERPGSLISGAAVIETLQRRGHDVILIDPARNGLPTAICTVDKIFIALHGWYGEDGKIQGYLETVGIPYTGSGVLASALGINKIAFKQIISSAGIPTPRYRVVEPMDINRDILIDDIAKTFGIPVVVKPWTGGGSLGVVIARSADELNRAVDEGRDSFGSVFVEEYVDGDFLTVGLLGEYGHPRFLQALRVTMRDGFYDYEAKHSLGRAVYEAPAKLSSVAFDQVKEVAICVYRLLGCHGPLRVDMMLGRSLGLQVLEVNTVPGLSYQSNLARVAAAAGMSYEALIEDILFSCSNKPRYMP